MRIRQLFSKNKNKKRFQPRLYTLHRLCLFPLRLSLLIHENLRTVSSQRHHHHSVVLQLGIKLLPRTQQRLDDVSIEQPHVQDLLVPFQERVLGRLLHAAQLLLQQHVGILRRELARVELHRASHRHADLTIEHSDHVVGYGTALGEIRNLHFGLEQRGVVQTLEHLERESLRLDRRALND